MKVKIGHLTFPVRHMDPDDRRFNRILGQFAMPMGIELHPDLQPQIAASVLLHEILHAIIAIYRISVGNAKAEERLVESLEGPLMALLVDNPWLAGAIQGASQGKPLKL